MIWLYCDRSKSTLWLVTVSTLCYRACLWADGNFAAPFPTEQQGKRERNDNRSGKACLVGIMHSFIWQNLLTVLLFHKVLCTLSSFYFILNLFWWPVCPCPRGIADSSIVVVSSNKKKFYYNDRNKGR